MGKSTDQIAAALNISYKTAETHRWRIRKKLGLTHQQGQPDELSFRNSMIPYENLREFSREKSGLKPGLTSVYHR
ncbi:MAG: LuxR C-terminal-related transcriptional regulator [Desulfobacterales bacterium]|nr:LuxR C-terminal-related transcriptional regulator [Desulfobacterales bacterium]